MSTPVQEGQQPQPQDGTTTVRVLPDLMEVQLIITPPRNGGMAVTEPQALQALAKAGVAFGLDHEAIADACKEAAGSTHGDPIGPVVVARGKPAARGEDAAVSYHELLQTPAGYPTMREDGKVDFFELSLVRNVAPGTVLAIRQPATRGLPGMNVLGAEVPGLDGKEVILKVGKGCRISESGLQIVADISGHAVMSAEGKITVSSIFEVRGDVDPSTGNIDFVGSVVVRGNINNGFTVKAEQNVEVHGGIDGGTVEAGGDVTVRFGIQGAGRGRVVAGGLVRCRFMENADLRCRDLAVTDGILHSKVRCSGKVNVTGRRGSIIGGQIKARDEVNARILGSNLATMTEIDVGISPETREELDQVRRGVVAAEEGLRKAMQAVSLLRDLEAKNPQEFSPAKKEMLMKSLRSLYHFQGQRDQLQTRKAALEEELQSSLRGKVRAYDVAYPGIKVMIGSESYVVIDELKRVCFYLTEQREVLIGQA